MGSGSSCSFEESLSLERCKILSKEKATGAPDSEAVGGFAWVLAGDKRVQLVTTSTCVTSILCSFLQSFPCFFCVRAFVESPPGKLSPRGHTDDGDETQTPWCPAEPLLSVCCIILVPLVLPAYVFSYGMEVILQRLC